VTLRLWDRRDPYRCACDNTYRPQLNRRGVLVKSKEPAWKMKEQTRSPVCLQELCRGLAKAYLLRYQHHKMSKGSGAGYPDVHLWASDRGGVWIELKRMGQNPTDIQVEIMASLQDAYPGDQAYLVRPCCLLVGVVDELMAAFAGVACRYIEGSPDGPVFPIPPAERPAGMVRHTPQRCAIEPVTEPPARRGRVPYREPVLPGSDPIDFPAATGVVVPQPAGAAVEPMRELEQWLRAAGFSPVDVPYPLRLVVGDGRLHVQCRRGLYRPGVDERVWREGHPADPFPDHLIEPLRAAVICGPSSAKVEFLIENAHPSITLPDAKETRC